MLDKKKKDRLIAQFKTHDKDTGSPEVQIAILTEEIKELADHLKIHRKDFSSRKGLIKKVNLRKKLLRYLEKENLESFEKLVTKLKIKISRRKDLLAEEEILAVEEEVLAEDKI
jgi:small subunit ribosomal protein S15